MILVFGKSGQVAKELIYFDKVVSVDRFKANLCDPSSCEKVIKEYEPEAVINAAAFTDVDRAEKEEKTACKINGIAPGIMAKACKQIGIPFVHISTDYVFDGSGVKAWSTNEVPKPQNAYGRTKLKGEEAIISSRANYAIVRTSWVVSSHGNNFLKTMLKLSKDHNTLNIVNDQIGGPTPARDIARACMEIAKQLILDPTKSGIYHFSGTPDTSWFKFAICIFKVANINTRVYPILTEKFPISTKRPLNSRLDCSNTFEKFNLKRPNWHEGLTEILKDLEVI